ncbi:MAG TPA: YeeE/YedE thiosulfate transporter family protein [Gemmatimonadaceae bacterium]|jgi:uncharacterized protein|nr:YeeE/YedE thiosulfate transporter family protein [Gemmatimonadaceae bacterium]
MILSWIRNPWPWYVSGPLIGLFVPVLLLLGNKQLGMTGALRATCAAIAPANIDFFRYDWKKSGGWNIALAVGILIGALLAVILLGGGSTPAVSSSARDAIAALGLAPPAGLVPAELLSWRALLTFRGAISIVGGGFLVGFGSAYAGGCTSGHGIMGLATRQLASVIALIGIYAGGLLMTFVVFPLIF